MPADLEVDGIGPFEFVEVEVEAAVDNRRIQEHVGSRLLSRNVNEVMIQSFYRSLAGIKVANSSTFVF